MAANRIRSAFEVKSPVSTSLSNILSIFSVTVTLSSGIVYPPIIQHSGFLRNVYLVSVHELDDMMYNTRINHGLVLRSYVLQTEQLPLSKGNYGIT